MKYNPDLEIIIAVRADGGAVSSTVYPEDSQGMHYHYLCAFDDEEYARNFVQQKLNMPVFFTKKKLSDLAKEFNSSVVWPGLTGIAFVHSNDTVEHIDTGSFVKMAFDDMIDINQRYGCELVCNDKIQNVTDIDFNKMYHIVTPSENTTMIQTTYTESGKRKEWLVISPSKRRINKVASEYGLSRRRCEIYSDTLFGILSDFMPDGQFHGCFSGILYVDANNQKYITNKQLITIMKKRGKMLSDMLSQREIYLDENYFVATYSDGCPVQTEIDDTPYLLISQRMDTMMKALAIDEADLDDVIFTNVLTLREIIEDCPGELGIALCLDDNPDHIAIIKVDKLREIAIEGVDETMANNGGDIVNVDEYMLTDRCTLIDEDGSYPIVLMVNEEDGEELAVMVVADEPDVLIDGLNQIEYPAENDTKPIWRPTCEIFEEFVEANRFDEFDGIMLFEHNQCALLPKEDIINMLSIWNEDTDQ